MRDAADRDRHARHRRRTRRRSLSRNLPAGRYRWEVTDPASGAQSSLRFHVGWWVEAELPDVPDKLEATLDKPSYQPGETAKLFVKAPFAGEAELAIASDRILSLRSLSLPAEGATLEIPVDAGWGSGVYALVSAYRPRRRLHRAAAARAGTRGRGRLARHRSGAAHARASTLAAPDVVRPRGPVDIPVKVAGLAAGEEAYVTLAAVDEAVLKLTEFDSPAPEKYYLRQAPARGRIARPLRPADRSARQCGRRAAQRRRQLRQALGRRPARQEQPGRRAVLRHRPARRRRRGDRSRFDIPDFQGQLRLMAVAFSAHKLGSGDARDDRARPGRDDWCRCRAFWRPATTARIGVDDQQPRRRRPATTG